MYKKGVIGQIPALMTSFTVVFIIIAALIVSSLFIAQPKTGEAMAYTDNILDRKIVVNDNNVMSEMTILEGVMKYQLVVKGSNPSEGAYGFEKSFENAIVDFLKNENTDYLPEDSNRNNVCLVLGVKQNEISKVLIAIKNSNGLASVTSNGKFSADLDSALPAIHYGISQLPRIYLKTNGEELNIYSYIGRCTGSSI